MPVLVLTGSRTALPWFADSARYVAEHAPRATVREVPGAGHFGVTLGLDAVADELLRFLDGVHQPA